MPHKTINTHRLWLIIGAIFISILLIAACGRGQSSTSSSGSAQTESAAAAPTMPAGKFVAVGEQSILSDTSKLTVTTQTTGTTTGAAPDLASGESAYTKNKCGDCHGAKGEGVADKGKAIAGTTLTLEEFDAILRTGGGLGNTHIFGRSAVSPSGMEALYAYVQSLKE
jgi:mono/diheme cytochrome c family protein